MLLVKVGGGQNINYDYIADDLAELSEPFILVHGANAKMAEITKSLGKEVRMITSPSGFTSRYTDQETLDIFLQSYCGIVNKRWVEKLQSRGINAVGLSGVDGRIWEGRRKRRILCSENGKTRVIKDSYTGGVENVNTHLINLLITNGYTPVITAPAISFDHEIINVDNDVAVGQMVKRMNIDKIVMLFEAPGLLKNLDNENSTIHEIKKNELGNILKFAKGRMKKKVLGAMAAFDNGLNEMYWGDGRVENPISKLFSGAGTIIR